MKELYSLVTKRRPTNICSTVHFPRENKVCCRISFRILLDSDKILSIPVKSDEIRPRICRIRRQEFDFSNFSWQPSYLINHYECRQMIENNLFYKFFFAKKEISLEKAPVEVSSKKRLHKINMYD